ncbi:MAG: tRNA (N(6)-L-threonylcarbamoyladenosine(37)-C(2))-methylthiotransferase MtaB [Armatimonadota bacterium]
MPTIAYHTLGCKVNQYETEKIRESMEKAGCKSVPFSSYADAYLINTCSVTAVADSKSRAAVRKALRLNPDAFIVVTGCYADIEPAQIRSFEGVGLVVAHDEKDAIAERLAAHFGISDLRHTASGMQPRPRTRTRAVVKVQDGCDQFCAYCVIPYARAGRKSRLVPNILDELRSLADFGYQEIVLAGIRLGSYEDGDMRLPELITKAAEIDGIMRIRLSSIEPWEVSDHLLDVMNDPKVCRHLHIPLQSGDSDVLARMNRPYDAKEYDRIISRVRERIDGIGITTDVIVGFPGETDREFANTCAMIERVDFSRLHVFRYSPRPRTKAADMTGQVDAETKRVRAEKLSKLGNDAMMRFATSHIGKTLEVLVETASGKGSKASGKSGVQLTGYADNYLSVVFECDLALRGSIAGIEIVGVDNDGCARGLVRY